MAVAIYAMVPSFPAPSLHGRSRLSRASGVAVPPPPQRFFAGDDARTTPLKNGELRTLMRRQCELVPFSDDDDDDDLLPPLLLSRENLQLQAQLLCSHHLQSPPLSLDNLNAPVSEDDVDVDVLAPMFSKEEIDALCAAHQASLRPAGTRSDDRKAGEKRRSPPWPSCISDDDVDDEPPPLPVKWARIKITRWSRAAHQASPRPAGTRSDDQQAGEKRTSPPWPSCMSDEDDDEPPPLPVKRARSKITRRRRVMPLPPPPPPPVKRARTKIRSRRPDGVRATQLRLREWHNKIARLILSHQCRAPELSRGRTALWCQCRELALADGGGCCALHQDTREPEDRALMYTAQGCLPLVGGPGRILVPTLSAGNSKATVVHYARWRRGVRMPTRFYVENAVAQQRGMAVAVDQQPEDDWRVTGAMIDIHGHDISMMCI